MDTGCYKAVWDLLSEELKMFVLPLVADFFILSILSRYAWRPMGKPKTLSYDVKSEERG